MSLRDGDPIDAEFLGYRIEEPLGRGGMGVVYRAHDVRLKRTVALKLIAPEFAADPRFHERFSRESEVAMSLEHPNVVPIHDAGDVDGRLYLVMRCVEGTDLRALLRREGALEPARALAIVRQVGNALDAAHERGLVHRDVKPSNVLLDANEHVYLADFGLTRRFAENGSSVDARSLGTPAYLAPEQIEGRAIDGRADVYSLGCLLYECLTGAPPFAGPSRLAVAWAHLEEEPPRASEGHAELPEPIDGVLRKAMAKDPNDRYPTCAELVGAAEIALGLGRRSRWRRPALLAAAAVVAAGALAAALAARAGDEAAPPLGAEPNKLIRVDPRTNAISAVIDVGDFPSGVAAADHSVWVYNLADHTVSEIDTRTNEVVQTAEVSTVPLNVGPGTGPIAADADGAWIIGSRDEDGSHLLTRVLSKGRGTHEHGLNAEPEAVAVGENAVWVLAHETRSDVIFRVDARSGAVTRRTPMPDGRDGGGASAAERRASSGRVDSLAVGGGFVWAAARDAGTLYRVDPTTGGVQVRDLGTAVLRPVFGFGRVWICVDRVMTTVEPRTFRVRRAGTGLAGEREYVPAFGFMWRYDETSGTLMRFDPRTGDLAGLTSLRAPYSRQVAVTSLAAGAGSIWLTYAWYS